jgi:hypothetical protein
MSNVTSRNTDVRRTRFFVGAESQAAVVNEFSSGEFAEQAQRGKKINRFKAFGEPVVNPFQ